MKGEQLNLFDQPETKRMAEIIMFPVNREAAFVRETARILAIRQGASAERFWQMTCRRLFARLQVQGVPTKDAREQVNAFSAAVHAQMQRNVSVIHEDDYPRGAA